MHKIHELKESLCNELEEYAKKDSLTASELDIVDKLAHTVKNLDKIIEAKEGYSMDGHSGRRYVNRSYDGGSYDGSYDGSYADGSSGDYSRRGRGPGAKRDSMGRYSSRGYSGAVEDIRHMMEEEQDPNKRHRYQGILQDLEA
jgi:hypothetical protein